MDMIQGGSSYTIKSESSPDIGPWADVRMPKEADLLPLSHSTTQWHARAREKGQRMLTPLAKERTVLQHVY